MLTINNSNISCEPMDVDLSGNSASKMDISYNKDDDEFVFIKAEPDNEPVFIKTEPDEVYVSNRVQTPLFESVENKIKREQGKGIKKYHNKSCRKGTKIKRSQIDMRIKLLLLSLFLMCISVLTHLIIHFKCCEQLDLKHLKETLSNNIYGQPKAVDAIIEALTLNVRSKIMFFYGGTGVGKTFAISLMLETLETSSNIYHYTMPSFANTFSTEFMLGLTICKTTIMIVDDLTANDMHINSHINDLIAKSENLGKNITIILVYNCDNITGDFINKQCDRSFYKDLKESFINVNAEKKIIKFNPLTEEHLKKCIEKEMGLKQLIDMDNILKNFNVSLDGCKGVHTKIKFLNIM